MDRVTRRRMLKWMGMGSAAAVLAACAPATPTPAPKPTDAPKAAATEAPKPTAVPATAAPKPTDKPTAVPAPATSTPVPTAQPRIWGTGKTEIIYWYQDWAGAVEPLRKTCEAFVKANPDVTINAQGLGYSDLLAKMLPAIAAGTEGDVMQMYTDWLVATDVSKVYLDMTEAAGGYAALAAKMFPVAFQAVDAPANKVFYAPGGAGIRGAVLSVNKDHCAEAGVKYEEWKTFEEAVQGGIKMTKKDASGKLTQAGFSPRNFEYQVLWTLMWQLGGKMFDKATGKWSHNSPEGEAAAQMIYDLYWKHNTCDFALFTSEYEAVSQKRCSMWGDGAWTAGSQTDTAKVPADNIVIPPLANAKEYVVYPQHVSGYGCSRRLPKDATKMKAAVDFAMFSVSAANCVENLQSYSGTYTNKEVYSHPRINEVKYGLMSKKIAFGVWERSRYTQDHVAQHGPAATELNRAMRKEISIKEALANMDKYLQEQENTARERLGIK